MIFWETKENRNIEGHQKILLLQIWYMTFQNRHDIVNPLTFTFMHFIFAFIQSNFQCIQTTLLPVCAFPGNQTHNLGIARNVLELQDHLHRKPRSFYFPKFLDSKRSLEMQRDGLFELYYFFLLCKMIYGSSVMSAVEHHYNSSQKEGLFKKKKSTRTWAQND